jgi:hypothetical protein
MKKLNLFLIFVLLVSKLYSQNIPSYIPKEADLGVNDIFILDSSNVKNTLGLSKESFEELLNQYFPPHINYANKDSSELLVLFFHPGSYIYEFSEFQIFKRQNNFPELYRILPTVESFKTFKGLYIGMDIKKFRNVMGNNFEEEHNNGVIILKYKLSGEYPELNNNKFLIFYKTHMYYGYYSFNNGKLAKIEFGCEYP